MSRILDVLHRDKKGVEPRGLAGQGRRRRRKSRKHGRGQIEGGRMQPAPSSPHQGSPRDFPLDRRTDGRGLPPESKRPGTRGCAMHSPRMNRTPIASSELSRL